MPAKTARALKVALYIGVGVAVWLLYHHFESRPELPETNALEADSAVVGGDDYSIWEPEQ